MSDENQPNPFSDAVIAEIPHFNRTDYGLLCWAVRTAGRYSPASGPRWSFVMDVFGVGSTAAKIMCREAGFDPDETVGTRLSDDD